MPEKNAAKPLSLKAFTQALEKRLASRSADELRQALILIGQGTPPAERRAFLDQLKAPTGRAISPRTKARSDELLADIDDCIDDIQEFQEAAGEWEDEYAWRDGYYDDEDSLGPYRRFVEPLTELFRRAQRAFSRGDLLLAREAYAKLFTGALQLDDSYGRGVRAEDLEDLDIREHRARYLRAIYETETPRGRPGMVLAAMAPSPIWTESDPPRLADLIEISSKPLPDWDRFLRSLKRFWRRSLDAAVDVDEWPATRRGNGKQRKLLEHIYAGELARWRWQKGEPETLLAWCLAVAKKRVAAIVGGQHRRDYDMAAALSAACMEVLQIRGQAEAGRKLLDDLYARYPRHRAFLSEVDQAAGRTRRHYIGHQLKPIGRAEHGALHAAIGIARIHHDGRHRPGFQRCAGGRDRAALGANGATPTIPPDIQALPPRRGTNGLRRC
jgi:hypothetical protein